MRKQIAIVLGMLLTLAASVSAQVSDVDIDVNDFLPIVAGGKSEVAKPSAVKVAMDEKLDGKNKVVEADSAQDAINAAVEENKSPEREIGCTVVKFPSGMGYVATGVATYQTLKNPTASRLSKRQAYVNAFIVAKKNLAEYLNGLSVDNVNGLKESFDSVNTSEESAQNLLTLSMESNKQVLDAVLRGFVIYNVEDVEDESSVFVTIVSTPKTLGKLSRLSSGFLEAETIQDGLAQVFSEIKSGLVPPIGGKAIQVASTGETAFVGFGSAVIDINKNKAIQAKMKLAAKKIADVRAKAALCGMIVGDQVYWKGELTSEQDDSVKGFNVTNDPINENRAGNIDKLDEQRNDFFNRTKNTDEYRSAQKGTLPPGISTKSWTDADGAWTYSMSVYLPSVTRQAAEFKEDMDSAQIVQPIKKKGAAGESGDAATPSNSSHKMDSRGTGDGEAVEQGVTGKVSSDDDL